VAGGEACRQAHDALLPSGGGQAAAVEGGDDGVPVDPRQRGAVADARCSFDMAGEVVAFTDRRSC
jgi:hypothetical protein